MLIVPIALSLAPDVAFGEVFSSTGEHSYNVPSGATGIHVVATGGHGGGFNNGGPGAVVTADLPVSTGEKTLYVEVASNGEVGGFNGGVAGGGGASDIRTIPGVLESRLLVAGGGGGGTIFFKGGGAGYAGGGGILGGQAGTKESGGLGGGTLVEGVLKKIFSCKGANGSLAIGGGAGPGGAGGGGGGGGYYGGGGGGAEVEPVGFGEHCESSVGGGGGGSSYASPVATNVSMFLVSIDETPQVTITVPLPVVSALPTIAGGVVSGDVLTESHGLWVNSPLGYTYQWERCSGSSSCTAIPGATGLTYNLSTNDVGSAIRVRETASNFFGIASATSPLTGLIEGPQILTQGSTESSQGSTGNTEGKGNGTQGAHGGGSSMPSRVESRMHWTFGWARRYTVVKSLVVREIPPGASIDVTCNGRGCPFAHEHAAGAPPSRCHKRKCKAQHPARSGSEASLAQLFQGHHIGVGAHISVLVTKAGWVGKAFLFTTRSNEEPREQSLCLAPGSTQPGRGC